MIKKSSKRKLWIEWMLVLILLSACDKNYTPKQKGFNRIDLPESSYVDLKDTYPYQFKVSKWASVEPHNSPYADSTWIDIKYYDFNAEIQLTYKAIEDNQMFNELIDDSYKLTSKHQVKASAIDRTVFETPNGYSATVFELDGEVPSSLQFIVSDSTKNFIRGAMYFKTATKNDSLRPIIKYIKADAFELINSLEFKN